MDNLPLSTPEEVAKRLRALGEGLTDPADVAEVNKYVDELEREAKAAPLGFEGTSSTRTPRQGFSVFRV
jgi:hypothetical protein